MSQEQAKRIAEAFIEKQMELRWVAWQASSNNQKWDGEVAKKKLELMRQNPLPKDIPIYLELAESLLKHTPPPRR